MVELFKASVSCLEIATKGEGNQMGWTEKGIGVSTTARGGQPGAYGAVVATIG
jgi:hypothetical protein